MVEFSGEREGEREGKFYHVIPQRPNITDTLRKTRRIRRSQIRGEEAQHTHERILVPQDLGAPALRREGVQIRVRPRVAPDLVAGRVHPSQDVRVPRRRVVDVPVVLVVAHDEEGRLDAVVGVEHVEQVRRVLPGPVVERQRYLARHGAGPDVGPVGHAA